MPENLYSKGQKVLTSKGRDNWDRIFGEREEFNLLNMESPLGKGDYIEYLVSDKCPKDKIYFFSEDNLGIKDAVCCENVGDE